MVYSIRIPKKHFHKLKEMCKNYNSYRECVIKEIEKKYNFPIYSSKKAHDMRINDDLLPKTICIIFYDEENKRLTELANKMGMSKYEIIRSILQ
jgi:predicted DNA-binding protein